MKPYLFSAITTSDIPSLRMLQPEFWGDIIPTLQWYTTLDFVYLTKVKQDEQLLGCGAAIEHAESIWLANIIVAKDARNMGIGTMITAHLLEYAKQKNKPVFLIATKLGRPVYTKFGFKDDEEYVFFKPHFFQSSKPDQIIPYAPQYKEDILKLDAEVTGEIRPQLLLPRLNEAWVYIEKGNFLGFAIPTLGEGLTLAKTKEAGVALMDIRFNEPKRACLPISNTYAIEHLLEKGFEKDDTLWGIKMYLNQKPDWKPKLQFGRVGGNMG
jgi:GNAT superfamily N-acetyltransferase